MNPAMKQRLVGTLVLGSLALILIPLLLDGEGVEQPPLPASIPPAPVFDTSPLPEPERPEILADSLPAPVATALDASAEAQTAAQAATTTTEPAAAPPPEIPAPELAATPPEPVPEPEAAPVQSASEPALSADGLPETWTVRLGVFGDRANADGLFERLQDAGHKAYIRPVGTLSGVYVGPVLTRNEAVALQNELKTTFQISDVIVQRFDIAQ